MKNIQKNSQSIGQQEFNLVEKVIDDTNVINANPYPTDGSIFLLNENANVLDKNADSYPAGTIKAYGFKAGDGNYYAVDVQKIPDRQYWGGYNKEISNILSTSDVQQASQDYNGEQNTTEIITQLKDYNDNYTVGAPAAEACRARTFNGKQGFLPALGQLFDFYSYNSEINSLATKFSLDAFLGDYALWTSTQYSPINSWILDWDNNGNRYGNVRNYPGRIRAFFAL